SMQQKHEKIRQIHEQAKSEREALINSQQEQALKSCRAQRGGGEGRGEHMPRAGGGGGHHGGGSPCGGKPSATHPTRGGQPTGGNNRTAGSGQSTGRPNPSTQSEPDEDEDPR